MDTFPDRVFRGRVDSISAGTGARFSLLPPENASGNWVKVVQRVPVKILLEDYHANPHLLRAGMSALGHDRRPVKRSGRLPDTSRPA